MHKRPCSILFLLAFLFAAVCLTPGKTFPRQLPPLVLQQPVERELGGNQQHTYSLTPAADEFLCLEVQQYGVDVVATLLDASGQSAASSNLFNAKRERIVFLAAAAGEFRLTIRAANRPNQNTAAGRYVLTLTERRAATDSDRQRAAAARKFEAAEQLRQQATTESRRAADEKFSEALTLFRAAADRRGEAFTLFYLGVNAAVDRRRAANLYQQALPLLGELDEALLECHLLQQTGSLLHSLGESQQAQGFFQRALPLAQKLGESRREAAIIFSLGTVHAALGERLRSIEYQQQALRLWQSLGDQAEIARTLAALGSNYEALGDKQKAIEAMLQALPGLKAARENELEIRTLYSLGLAYDSLYERRKAVEFYQQALARRLAAPPRAGQAAQHRSLGNIYEGLGDLPKALAEQRLSLKAAEQEKDLRGQAQSLRNLGLVLDKLNRKREAAEHFERALPLFRAGADKQTYARLLTNYGKVLAELGEPEAALKHLREALPLLRQLGQRFFELHALYWIARAERLRGESGDLVAARASIESALGLIETLRGEFYQPELRTAGFTRAQEFYELALDLLLREQKPALHAAAFELSERARARTLLELLAEARISLQENLSPELRQRKNDAQTRLTALQSELIQLNSASKPNPQRLAVLQTELREAEKLYEQTERDIRRQFPRYAELQSPMPLNAEAARALLDDETALLEYFIGQEHSFLFVVTRESVRAHRLPGAEEFAELVRGLRQTLNQPGRRDFGEFTRTARRLYELLVAPTAETLNRKKRLLIAPDQSLHYLPFECLLTGAANDPAAGFGKLDYLLKRWEIAYVPSAGVLSGLRRDKRGAYPAAKEFVAFADPVYPARPAAEQTQPWSFAPLPESRREAEQIAGLYPPEKVSLYLGAAAKEENVKAGAALSTLSTARRIHFATHGILNEDEPQYSGLVLTLDEDPREDGLLQVHEIFNLKLQADLVVLSACRTGLGRHQRGEGLIGLTRAFLYAGAPSVVVSLWQAADRSTADLMTHFYQHLESYGDKAAALRRAKLELLAAPRTSHPYFWASFVLIGETKQR